MIDLHAHILPNMDDGSASPEETNKILDLMYQQGVTTVFATSHFYANKETPREFLTRRNRSVSSLVPSENPQPQLILGAEVAYFSGVGICEEIIPLQLGNTKLLLIEMPFGNWSDRMVKEICDIPQNLGLIPVLAHINRYRSRHQFPKHQETLKKAGVLFHCNCDVFSDRIKRGWTMKQFKNGNIHFFGSDCHNLDNRPPNITLAFQYITKKMGAAVWEAFNKEVENLLQIKQSPE